MGHNRPIRAICPVCCASPTSGAAKMLRARVTKNSHPMQNLMAFSPCRFTEKTVGFSLRLPPGHAAAAVAGS